MRESWVWDSVENVVGEGSSTGTLDAILASPSRRCSMRRMMREGGREREREREYSMMREREYSMTREREYSMVYGVY
jgi:hypothetical protein